MLTLLVRSVLVYIFITIAVRIMGKRQIGQLQVSELVVTIIISELSALPLIEEGTPLLRVFLPITLLCAFELLTTALPILNPKLVKFFDGAPSILINDGKINRTEMRKQRVTMQDICEVMRGQGFSSIDQLSAVVLETSGYISILPKQEYAPATASQVLKHTEKDAGIAVIIVMDGKINDGGLQFYGHDENWLFAQLQKQDQKLEDVFFMSVDGEEKILTILRKDTR